MREFLNTSIDDNCSPFTFLSTHCVYWSSTCLVQDTIAKKVEGMLMEEGVGGRCVDGWMRVEVMKHLPVLSFCGFTKA